ncbi:lysoplasmalogenase [Sporosarcina limicola]|uniref:Membrane protein YhhN n=1 Tax=Sporosarcina limicola TaxID=34101 RepID=A0A927RDG9_9BACL|nr:lysoplasmalogenase [Sporosarcina limicola]MBE1555330.1 putative membrane protein YhhN [Sporosarcina limicola]
MGIIYIFFIPADPTGFKIFMKLIPMALIILFAVITRPLFSLTYKQIILAGVFVCMIADGVIYWFFAGLVTFFIGHIFYILAFRHARRKQAPIWAAVPLLLYGFGMAYWIAGSQFKIGQTILGVAIIAYIGIILTMGWMAIRTRLKLAIIGAMLFIFSDSVLAIDRFVYAIPYRDMFVMVTYYAAQIFIAASVGSRVVKYSVNPNNLIR